MVRNKRKTEGKFCGVNHVLLFLSFMLFLKLLEGTICLETRSKCLEDGQSGTVSSFPPLTILGRSECWENRIYYWTGGDEIKVSSESVPLGDVEVLGIDQVGSET